MPTVYHGYKLCEQCVHFKPIDQFRRRHRDRDDRQGQCRECHNQSEKLRLAKKRSKKNHALISKFVTDLKNEILHREVRACGFEL